MDFWNSLSGMVEVELASGDIGATLSAMNRQNIPVFNTKYRDELTARFYLQRKDYKQACVLCQKRGDRLCLLGYRGIYWSLWRILHRPVLLGGLCLLLAFTMYVPTRVFFVRVEGNNQIPGRQILAAAEDCGICFGAFRREVRSEKVKNALLSALPQLQWACVNTSGCVAIISVREEADLTAQQKTGQVGSIVACTDGIIESATAVSGSLVVSAGQAVKEGQLLISGYTDCGLLIQVTRAEGEIFAQTKHEQTVKMPVRGFKKMPMGEEFRVYSLLLGKKRINLWNNSRIWGTTYDRIYEQYDITLPGGFQLPVALCVERYISCDVKENEIPQADAEEKLTGFADAYLVRHMVAGNILHRDDTFFLEDDAYILEGRYTCREMIGRLRPEKMGEEYGKDN